MLAQAANSSWLKTVDRKRIGDMSTSDVWCKPNLAGNLRRDAIPGGLVLERKVIASVASLNFPALRIVPTM